MFQHSATLPTCPQKTRPTLTSKALPFPTPETELLLIIELRDVEPVVWRRVVVPRDVTLNELHVVLIVTMGWEGDHLHEFKIGEERYGIPDPDGWDSPVTLEEGVRLIDALAGKKSFRYLYDFGDGWDHLVKIENLPAGATFPHLPYCLEGANACPPEDIGGPRGYAGFVEALADPRHPDHKEMKRMFRPPFEPTEFDMALTNHWLLDVFS
ncbi:plasmid pRiA4b ORF-3 family protein [Pseudomonas sp. NPDC090202]|uniref:plasmid pRiA4b ORF-3 family protein n=1 Tax=unclassified Pseudomonas TaxID=196821 RepID=UPI0037FCCD82